MTHLEVLVINDGVEVAQSRAVVELVEHDDLRARRGPGRRRYSLWIGDQVESRSVPLAPQPPQVRNHHSTIVQTHTGGAHLVLGILLHETDDYVRGDETWRGGTIQLAPGAGRLWGDVDAAPLRTPAHDDQRRSHRIMLLMRSYLRHR